MGGDVKERMGQIPPNMQKCIKIPTYKTYETNNNQGTKRNTHTTKQEQRQHKETTTNTKEFGKKTCTQYTKRGQKTHNRNTQQSEQHKQ